MVLSQVDFLFLFYVPFAGYFEHHFGTILGLLLPPLLFKCSVLLTSAALVSILFSALIYYSMCPTSCISYHGFFVRRLSLTHCAGICISELISFYHSLIFSTTFLFSLFPGYPDRHSLTTCTPETRLERYPED